ncbi:hypothetical protein XYCOK13_30040 [Xylanibacillus composti]|uniref:SLH domain-containing protein n=1 Tax=Xylanibacillus composti TaxID=1572762 RepID=A0A8J4H5T4_9BACL|nr:N-acetylmuramoyl-L-alanine amidase [Xylanibacillus composti]GIQ70180.1 hypothetical protein XYCOK13_30040 [Xylanibacillus composti]
MMGKWMKAAAAVGVSAMLFCTQVDAAKVIVDPGHGGRDPGAIGVNQLREKDVNLDIALKLKQALINKGYTVAMTRDNDIYLTLQERVEHANREQADIFVSIHANAHPSSTVRGSMVLYYDRNYPQANYPASPEMSALTPQSKALASYVLDEMVRSVGTQNRGLVPSAAYVVRSGKMPSILVETAFLSNPQDAALLASEWAKISFAEAIAEGIARFLPIGFADIAGHWASGAIVRLKEEGLVAGNNGKFEPNRGITRAEFLALADRIFDLNSLQQASTEPPAMDGEAGDAHDWQAMEKSEENESSTVTPKKQTLLIASDPSANMAEQDSIVDATYDHETVADEESEQPIADSSYDGQARTFTDLSESHWAYALLETAVSTGFLEGYPDGTIRPDQTITRAEMSVLFDRIWQAQEKQAIEQSGAGELVPDLAFADVPAQTWFADSVYRMARAALINGIEPHLFGPDQVMTRAQMAVVFDRYLQQF